MKSQELLLLRTYEQFKDNSDDYGATFDRLCRSTLPPERSHVQLAKLESAFRDAKAAAKGNCFDPKFCQAARELVHGLLPFRTGLHPHADYLTLQALFRVKGAPGLPELIHRNPPAIQGAFIASLATVVRQVVLRRNEKVLQEAWESRRKQLGDKLSGQSIPAQMEKANLHHWEKFNPGRKRFTFSEQEFQDVFQHEFGDSKAYSLLQRWIWRFCDSLRATLLSEQALELHLLLRQHERFERTLTEPGADGVIRDLLLHWESRIVGGCFAVLGVTQANLRQAIQRLRKMDRQVLEYFLQASGTGCYTREAAGVIAARDYEAEHLLNSKLLDKIFGTNWADTPIVKTIF